MPAASRNARFYDRRLFRLRQAFQDKRGCGAWVRGGVNRPADDQPACAGLERLGHLAAEAGRHPHQPLAVPGEVLPVDARLVVVAVDVGVGDEPAEVAVADEVGREEDQVERLRVGLALAVAPVGAWLAVVDRSVDLRELAVPIYLGLAVIFWLAGFDIIYALQDREFDRVQGLFSVPVRFGVARSLQISTLCHLCTIAFLGMVGISAGMGTIYWIGWLAVIAVLIWEHRIVSPNDLSRINRAFFDLNAYVSIAFFCATVVDLLVAHAA